MKRAVVGVALLALAAPAGAAAHATLLRTSPADGSVVARSPDAVRVFFDDTVRTTGGNAAVANASGASVLAGSPRARGRTLILPLRPDLPHGDYSVRWSIVSDDGHHEEGVVAFGVGAGSAAPTSVLGASAGLTWWSVVLRALYLLGTLGSAGTAVFWLLGRNVLGERLHRPLAHLLFACLFAAFVGAGGIAQSAASGTRFAHALDAAAGVAAAGAALAALAPPKRRLLAPAAACALLLALAPTLAGHALDPSQPRALSVPVDLVHVYSVAVWFGGLLALVFVLPRGEPTSSERAIVVRRFSRAALVAVAALALSGLGRALTELGGVSQVWSTSYGRALIVKTAIFVPLLAIGWLNRTFLLGAVARLRRSAALEATAIVAIVAVVAVLTQLRPGSVAPARGGGASVRASGPAVLPPRSAVVDAHRIGSLAVGIGRTPGRATVTILDPDGEAGSDHVVRIGGTLATPCGSGCYRAGAANGPLVVSVDGRSTTFDLPVRAPDARAQLARITRAYRGSRSIVFDETLSSGSGQPQVSRFAVVAPDRLTYVIRDGPAAIVIGARRWDRDRAGAPYVESAQTPIAVTEPYWQDVSNVHRVAPGVLTFLDRELPAWFRVSISGGLPRRSRMTAASHFMVDRYVGFDGSVEISPPSR